MSSPITTTKVPEFAPLANATSLPWSAVPEISVAAFVHATAAQIERGGRLCAWFGVPEGAKTRLVAVVAFDADNTLAVARSAIVELPVGVPFVVPNGYPALTPQCAQAHLFERELWEQHGLVPEGHPWLKPVRKNNGNAPAVGEFFRVEGHEVHEVAVGPVHAGVIEPGHFRFQCAGEEVLHLEIALGYQHRGVEEALAGGPHRTTLAQMETVAGDSTIATRPHTRWCARRSRGRRRRCERNGCAPSRSNSSDSRTTPATSARWPTTWRFCRRRRRAENSVAIS